MVTVNTPQWEEKPRAELVVRLEVPGSCTNFPAAVAGALGQSKVTHDLLKGAAVVLSQPLLTDSDTEVWELRLSAPSWADAGAIFDAVSSSKDGAKPLLRALSKIEGTTMVSAGAPLYRAWTLAASTKTSDADSTPPPGEDTSPPAGTDWRV